MKTIITFILSALFVCTTQAQNTQLALNLEKGQVYKLNNHSIASINQTVNGQEMKIGMSIVGILSFTVKSVNDSSYDMDAKYDKLEMSMQMPQGTMKFSSEKKDSTDFASSMLSAMKNKTFEVTMDKIGKITEVKNIDNLWGSVIDQFQQIPEMQRKQMKAQIMRAYGSKAIKGNIETVTAIYPGHPVQKGDKWTINTDLQAGMAAKMSTEYQLVDLTPDDAIIKGTSSIQSENKDAYVQANGMSMKYNITGTMLSNIKVDKKTGWIISATIHQEMKGNIVIKGNPQMPDGMNIPMSMENDIVITNQ